MKIFMCFTENNFNGFEDAWYPQILLGSYELYKTSTQHPSKIYTGQRRPV